MGKWEPLADSIPVDVRRLATQLRRMKDRSGLTVPSLAARTGQSAETWSLALAGRRLPPLDAVEVLAQASGADYDRVGALYELARKAGSGAGGRGRGKPVPHPDPLDPLGPEEGLPASRRLLMLVAAGALAVAALVGVMVTAGPSTGRAPGARDVSGPSAAPAASDPPGPSASRGSPGAPGPSASSAPAATGGTPGGAAQSADAGAAAGAAGATDRPSPALGPLSPSAAPGAGGAPPAPTTGGAGGAGGAGTAGGGPGTTGAPPGGSPTASPPPSTSGSPSESPSPSPSPSSSRLCLRVIVLGVCVG